MLNELIHSFVVEVVQNSASVPVIITNSDTTEILACGNIPERKINKARNESVKKFIQENLSENPPIKIILNQKNEGYIFYNNSPIITQLTYYPPFLLLVSILLGFIAYYTLRSFEKNEKDQLWVGMSKETAHQLGTPISSLMAWIEILKMNNVDSNTLEEINKDVNRLETIACRFSKIGSTPDFSRENVGNVVENAVNYMRNRTSQNIESSIHIANNDIYAMVNISLLGWVIENLWKNAVDAMQGKGTLTINVSKENNHVCIDVSDTGKGLPRNKFKTIFQPGYTTKSRGWGLGLSLAQRIVKEYHHGKIMVKSSEIDKGTTFRICLPLVK
jgi:signal transduction histidine kinase